MRPTIKNLLFIIALTCVDTSALCNETTNVNVLGPSYLNTVFKMLGDDFSAIEQHFFLNYLNEHSSNEQAVPNKALFSVSDIALNSDQLVSRKLIQLPLMATAIVPVVNIPGIDSDKLVLDGNTLAAIMTGEISSWNHESIKVLNPSLNLPALHIKTYARDKECGATIVFTTYLAKNQLSLE